MKFGSNVSNWTQKKCLKFVECICKVSKVIEFYLRGGAIYKTHPVYDCYLYQTISDVRKSRNKFLRGKIVDVTLF